jgi:hypothetical protein
MLPFSKPHQLIRDLDLNEAGKLPIVCLPGQPSIKLDDSTRMKHFLEKEFYSKDLETIAPRLWVMTTLSSANINPLHRQRVKGREIIVTEEPIAPSVDTRSHIHQTSSKISSLVCILGIVSERRFSPTGQQSK